MINSKAALQQFAFLNKTSIDLLNVNKCLAQGASAFLNKQARNQPLLKYNG
jgi:hypothetical protein